MIAGSHNLTQVWCEFPTGRITITQTLDRMRLCIRMKVRFSDVLLVSHGIRCKNTLCCCSSSGWHMLMWRSRSHLGCVSALLSGCQAYIWLSGLSLYNMICSVVVHWKFIGGWTDGPKPRNHFILHFAIRTEYRTRLAAGSTSDNRDKNRSLSKPPLISDLISHLLWNLEVQVRE